MIEITVQNTGFIPFARKDSYLISYMCIYVLLCVSYETCGGASGGWKRTWDPLK